MNIIERTLPELGSDFQIETSSEIEDLLFTVTSQVKFRAKNIGHISCGHLTDGNEGMLYSLWVCPRFRKRLVGYHLMQNILRDSCRRRLIHVRANSNPYEKGQEEGFIAPLKRVEALKRHYRRLGFEVESGGRIYMDLTPYFDSFPPNPDSTNTTQ